MFYLIRCELKTELDISEQKETINLKHRATAIHQALLDFYGYPSWRNPLPPLDELISTILSQNTNDTNRDQAYESLRQRFSTWEAVSEADPQEVIDAIRSAGLANQKGPHIQAVLRQILENHGELNINFLKQMSPIKARDWLLRFKGVGPKTAAIVLLFSLDMPAFPVDTHVFRVSGRLGIRPYSMNANRAHDHLAELFPPETYYAVHLNLIRLGREICQARKPLCPRCPLQSFCDYFAENY